jgi:hypothetical protein
MKIAHCQVGFEYPPPRFWTTVEIKKEKLKCKKLSNSSSLTDDYSKEASP